MRMKRSRVGVWIEHASRNERTTPTREIVPCRPASYADRNNIPSASKEENIIISENAQKKGPVWLPNGPNDL